MSSIKNISRTKWILAAAILLFILLIANLICQSESSHPGQVLYEQQCQNCHMEDGKGLQDLIPPLAGADYVQNNQQLLPCIMKYGQAGPIVINGKIYDQPMPANMELTAGQITNIINYINNSWGNDFEEVQLKQVEEWLDDCEDKTPVEIDDPTEEK